MSANRPFSAVFILSILASVACSSSTPQAQSPVAEADPPPVEVTEPEKPPPAADPEPAPKNEEAKKEDTAPSPPATEAPKPEPKHPSEILTAENVGFELDADASAVKFILKDKCEERVGYEEEKVEKCVQQELDKFPADVLRFRKIGGQLRWTVYKRSGDRLQVVYSAPFSFTEESEYGVSLLLQGKGNGFQPLLSQSHTIPLRFPSADSVELDDPVWGQLVYRSKEGIVD